MNDRVLMSDMFLFLSASATEFIMPGGCENTRWLKTVNTVYLSQFFGYIFTRCVLKEYLLKQLKIVTLVVKMR